MNASDASQHAFIGRHRNTTVGVTALIDEIRASVTTVTRNSKGERPASTILRKMIHDIVVTSSTIAHAAQHERSGHILSDIAIESNHLISVALTAMQIKNQDLITYCETDEKNERNQDLSEEAQHFLRRLHREREIGQGVDVARDASL